MDNALQQNIAEYFKKELAGVLLKKMQKGHSLSKFKVNPFVLAALSSGTFGQLTSKNMAKALLYPRVLGTSISTTFGDKMQKLCVHILGADASSTPGMDIEFNDKLTKQRVIMQLKAGPNTINKGDVQPILSEMHSAYRLLIQNRVATNIMPLFAMGIAYGSLKEISSHYKKINTSSVGAQMEIPIYIGNDFWHRLTGDENFYRDMIKVVIELFEQEDYSQLLEEDLSRLQKQIEEKYFSAGVFDVNKV